jgi:hypothetical protein
MSSEQHEIGSHRIRIEGDVILSRWSGVLSLQELNQFFALLESFITRVAHPFLLVDNTRISPGEPAVRKRIFEWSRTHRVSGGIVVFDANPATRVIGLLVLNAIGLFKGSEFSKRVVIVPDEAAAHAWIDRRRRELVEPPARSA